jgi:hypothetical protein
MSDPAPNRRRIDQFYRAYQVYQLGSIAYDCGVTEAVISQILDWAADLRDDYEKCCFLDFLIRHGGVTLNNARRLLPGIFGGTGTNSCPRCGHVGHISRYCAW